MKQGWGDALGPRHQPTRQFSLYTRLEPADHAALHWDFLAGREGGLQAAVWTGRVWSCLKPPRRRASETPQHSKCEKNSVSVTLRTGFWTPQTSSASEPRQARVGLLLELCFPDCKMGLILASPDSGIGRPRWMKGSPVDGKRTSHLRGVVQDDTQVSLLPPIFISCHLLSWVSTRMQCT